MQIETTDGRRWTQILQSKAVVSLLFKRIAPAQTWGCIPMSRLILFAAGGSTHLTSAMKV
jgi:hypothetical protein